MQFSGTRTQELPQSHLRTALSSDERAVESSSEFKKFLVSTLESVGALQDG